MKLLQKTYPLVGIILVLYGGIFTARDKDFLAKNQRDKELQLINEAYRKVFAKEDLFAEKNKQTHVWKNMIKRLERYIDNNADGNKKLRKAYDLCKSVSNQLINTLTVVYNSVFANEEIPSMEGGDDWKIWDEAMQNIGRLEDKKTNLANTSNVLKDTQFYFESQKQKKNNVKKVLLRLMSILEVVINQLKGDFFKRYDAAYDKWTQSIPVAEPGEWRE